MAMPADSSASNSSPVSPVTAAYGGSGPAVNSPNSRRRLTSPWAQVVRGGGGGGGEGDAEATTVTAPRSPSSSTEKVSPSCSVQKCSLETDPSDGQPEISDVTNGALGPPKKPAWNKPLNGFVVAGSVMGGAVAWPALSECTRSTTKSSSDSSKPIPDGSAIASQGPIVLQLPQKQVSIVANSHSNANQTMLVRQRSMKHQGGSNNSVGSGLGGASSQSGFSRAPPPPPPPLPPPFPVMPYGNLLAPVLESRVRSPRPVGGVPSQPHATGDHSLHRNPYRKGNFAGRPRGDGSYHNNHGGRRDQDRRDVHLSPQFVPPPGGLIPPPSPGSAPFIPAPLRPFAGPLGYDMPPQFIYVPTLPPESIRGMPVIPPPPPPPFFFPVVDPNLPALLVKQIEYYFSDDNMVKDDFLRSKMDEDGWVPIELIANFPRVRQLTNNIQFILDCLRASTLVEVQDDKVRRRDDWKKWIHTSDSVAADSGSQAPGRSTENVLTSSLQVSFDESVDDKINNVVPKDVQVEVSVGGLSEELTSQSKLIQEGNAKEICSSHAGSSQVC